MATAFNIAMGIIGKCLHERGASGECPPDTSFKTICRGEAFPSILISFQALSRAEAAADRHRRARSRAPSAAIDKLWPLRRYVPVPRSACIEWTRA